MSKAGDAINRARAKIAAKGEKPFFDRCDLIPDPSLLTQGAGQTLTDNAAITNIPCSHRQLGGGGVRIDDGETVVTKTHEVVLPYTSTTVLINKRFGIRVHPRGLNEQVFFEQPVRRFDSGSPLLNVLCTMTEGFRNSATI